MKLLAFSFFLLVLQIAFLRDASALPSGAPIQACGDLTQQHGGFTPMICGPDCQFTVTLVAIDGSTPTSPNMYRCGSQHICKQSPINDSIVSIQTIWRIIDKFACMHACPSVHDIVWYYVYNYMDTRIILFEHKIFCSSNRDQWSSLPWVRHPG